MSVADSATFRGVVMESAVAATLDFTIARLGQCHVASPVSQMRFVADTDRVLYASTPSELRQFVDGNGEPATMECAGPRARIFRDPSAISCGIVTCGGLCPGVNDVIRAIVLSLRHHYQISSIRGFRFGFAGLVGRLGHTPLRLTADSVNRINEVGGSMLGSSRGPQDPAAMVDCLHHQGIGALFVIGGDGTLRGAHAICMELARRGLKIAVVAVPKTIDNDVSFVQKTFGFETAVSEARRATAAAHAEAESAPNGIGLVKVMGRDAGFIAAYAVLVDGQVNFCLIPEVPFTLERLLSELGGRLRDRGHAVVVVAEGAGQDLVADLEERDASGNIRHRDIGLFLRDAITRHFQEQETPITLKYVDPSYAIRSVRTTAHDAAFCMLLGHNAVHAAMAGRTDMVVGFWNHQFVHVPIPLAVSRRKQVDPDGVLWNSVLASTGQPRDMS
jgi:6-phosphofructokinase 1